MERRAHGAPIEEAAVGWHAPHWMALAVGVIVVLARAVRRPIALPVLVELAVARALLWTLGQHAVSLQPPHAASGLCGGTAAPRTTGRRSKRVGRVCQEAPICIWSGSWRA